MDFGSSRSRSRTPIVQLTRLEDENMANTIISQKTIERRAYTTRLKTIEGSTSSDEVFLAASATKTRQKRGETTRNRHKTSDYSSEDEHGENGEYGRNGSVKSALQVYKEAGEYWNKFPKTDYTYSLNSKDRMEVAPGVICMPNMSRKSLRRSMEPTPRYNADDTTYYSSNHVTRKTLNFDETDKITSIKRASVYRRFRSVITRFYRSITALLLVVFTAVETSALWTARSYYQTVSRLFLFDTWLMQKSTAPAAQSTRKYGAIVAIMLLPLLLFAGWTLWSTLVQLIEETRSNKLTTTPATPEIRNFDVNTIVSSPQFEEMINKQLTDKMAAMAADLSAIKRRLNDLDAGLLQAKVHHLQVNKCCKRQFIYLVRGVDENDLNARLSALRADFNAVLDQKILGAGGTITDAQIRRIVQDSLAVYDADKTGLVDYALESSGGQIVSTRCTENYHSRTAVVSILGVPLWYPSNTPRVVITPGATPGECWAFQNFPGFVVVQLSTLVRVTAVSLEHIPESLAPGGARDSAPRAFSVWGLKEENDRDPWNFGTFEYRLEGPPLQYFAVNTPDDAPPFNMVELRVESNHGNMNYTCLYRFRVHGNQA